MADLSRYLGLFVADARDGLCAVETAAVRLESCAAAPEHGAPSATAHLEEMFRRLHSLKSSAAMMGFEPISRLAHQMEAWVEACRRDPGRLADSRWDPFLEAAARMRELIDLASEGRPLPAGSTLELSVQEPGPGDASSRARGEPASDRTSESDGVGGPVTAVLVRLSTRSASPAARAFLVLRKLSALGEVLASSPPAEVLRTGGPVPGFAVSVTVRGRHADEVVARALDRVPEVEAVEIAGTPARLAAGAGIPEAVTSGSVGLATPAPLPAARGSLAPAEQTVKVRVELLDQLLELGGELVLAASRLRETVRALGPPPGPLEEEVDRLRLLVKDLNNRVLAARQSPVQILADRLPLAVRDLTRRLGKPLSFVVEGGEVTLDRGLLDALAEPLLHAVRNAADHGIEPPEERRRAGKPAEGRLLLSVRRERDRVVLELRDDGRGFDLARLRRKAVEARVLGPDEARELPDSAALRLAFHPGLSTRDHADDLSGRGVGMDAVLRAMEQMGGSVELESLAGSGSTVRFLLPTTVSVVNLLLVSVEEEVLGIPVGRVLYATEGEPEGEGAASWMSAAGERVPARDLRRLIGFPGKTCSGRRPFVVVEGEGRRAAFAVDRLVGQEEVVLRPLGLPLDRIRGLAGTAILGSGRPIFVLDVPRLVA